ncbi:MAG: hypothetical protein ACLUD2_17595 [Clostridium sp.]
MMNIAVSDIETLEYFLPIPSGRCLRSFLPDDNGSDRLCVTVCPALIPIYLIISVVLPASGIKGRPGIGMRYRERLGDLKSKILESVYSIRDI